MKLRTRTWCDVLVLLSIIILPSTAATLSEGDPAPRLAVSKWIQGEPVKAFQPGTVYLIEFWATWWLPCRESMAHVNHLHQKYKDKGLVVIGQNVKEAPGAKVEPFIKRMGDLMPYRIALDEGATNRYSGKMAENWLYSAEAGIPTAIIVDQKGIICFIGHPAEIVDSTMEQVLAGSFDGKKRADEQRDKAAKTEAWDTHNETGKAAYKAKQWDKAMSEIDEMEKLLPYKRATTDCLRIAVLIGKADFHAASKLAMQISDENRQDPFMQLRLARTLVKSAQTNTLILDNTTLILDRGVSRLNGPEPEFLHTQARLAFLQGKKEKAVELENLAMALADPETKEQFALALDHFKRGKL